MLKDEDKLPADITPGGRRMRCLNCRDNDHLAKNCPHPPAKRRCNMCGVEGHFGPRCPNKICLLVSWHCIFYFYSLDIVFIKDFLENLFSKGTTFLSSIILNLFILQQCGQQLPQFSYECGECVRDRNVICLLCGEIGHRQVFCPEQWRRYHSTVCILQLNMIRNKNKFTEYALNMIL